MAASMSPYEQWLSDKLLSLNSDVDGDVFVTYISGILDTETSNEEKKESLEGIIAEVASDSIDTVCDEIIAKWEEMNSNKDDSKENKMSVDEQLSKILSTQKLTVSKGRELTAEEKARKAAILAQYSEVCEGGDDSVSDEDEGAVGGDADFLMKNTNKADVDKNEREKREKAKKDSENKKEKDRLDREAQKAKNQDRKDTEKKRTQKGERRR